MWRIQGLSNAFKASTGLAADREIGQLVRITNDGEADDALGQDNKLFFPLMQKFIAAEDKVAEAQVTGIAKVYVEESTGITAGVPVGPGATGLGVQQAQDGEFILGIALATPAADGDYIPVLLTPYPEAGSIY